MSFLCSNIFHDLVFDLTFFKLLRPAFCAPFVGVCGRESSENKHRESTLNLYVGDVCLRSSALLFMFQQSAEKKKESSKRSLQTTSRQNKFMRHEEIN